MQTTLLSPAVTRRAAVLGFALWSLVAGVSAVLAAPPHVNLTQGQPWTGCSKRIESLRPARPVNRERVHDVPGKSGPPNERATLSELTRGQVLHCWPADCRRSTR